MQTKFKQNKPGGDMKNGYNFPKVENARSAMDASKSSFNNKPGTLLLKSNGAKWYNQRVFQPAKASTLKEKFKENGGKVSREEITTLRMEALNLLKTDIYNYEQHKSNSSKREDFEWIGTVLNSGTIGDKMAAHTILVQDSACHNLRSVEQLLRFVNAKGRRECTMAMDTLRDLFVGDLLVPKEKLHTFEELIHEAAEMNLLAAKAGRDDKLRKQVLLLAYVEDQIRALYTKFLEQVVAVGNDTLEVTKAKSLRTLFDLFVHNPEQEHLLLSSLANKLGDPTAKIASQASHLLSQVITSHHPQMKSVVVKEIERLLFRPNITARTEYYCLCFLSEMIFTASVDQALANRLVETYFTIFNRCTKKGEVNNKIMSVLLAGVTRAFPYSKLEVSFLQKYMETFYRLLHYVSLNTAVQTLALMFSLVNFSESGSLTDRFYATLYRFVFQPGLDRCSKCSMLLNLVYRAVKRDPIAKRVRAFVKQLLQVALVSNSSFSIGVLVLISETVKSKLGFSIQPSVFANLSGKETEENAKETTTKNLMFSKFATEDDDDGEERYFDVDKEPEELEKEKSDKAIVGGWVFRQENHQLDSKTPGGHSNDQYQINARNPLHAGAEREQLWELSLLSRHFHPTTRLFTSKLLNGETVDYDGDPMDDFTLKKFLDRFVFKNPKQDIKVGKKTSATFSVFGRRKSTGKGLTAEEMMSKQEAEVPVDEQFIHRFLKHKSSMARSKKGDDDDSDVESVTSLEFNDILDNYESFANEGEIDFAHHVKRQHNKSKRKTDDEDDEFDFDDDDADFDEELTDDELDDSDGASFKGDDYDVDYSDNDNHHGEDVHTSNNFKQFDLDFQDNNKKTKKNKKNLSMITNDIFASAEEFAHLLDANSDDSDFEVVDDTFDPEDLQNNQQGQKSKKGGKVKRPMLGRARKPKRVKLD